VAVSDLKYPVWIFAGYIFIPGSTITISGELLSTVSRKHQVFLNLDNVAMAGEATYPGLSSTASIPDTSNLTREGEVATTQRRRVGRACDYCKRYVQSSV